MAATLAQLRTRILRKADMENSSFIGGETGGGDELKDYINESYRELYDLLVSKNQDFFVKEPAGTLTIASGDSSVSLPADFYKLMGLDRDLGGGDYVEVRPFNFAERNVTVRGGARRGGRYARLTRRIIGDKMHVRPEADAPGTYRIWYVPKVTVLSAEADTLAATVTDWEEYVVVDCAIKCLLKEESDISALTKAKNDIIARIEVMAAQRDVGDVDRVADVQRSDYYAGEDY